MALVTYEQNTDDGDIILTNGDAPQLTDQDAVVQMILTRLRLFKGEWWENLKDGTPMFNDEVVGGSGSSIGIAAKAAMLRARIEGTPYVKSVMSERVQFDAASRVMVYACNVVTQFGTVKLSVSGSSASIGG